SGVDNGLRKQTQARLKRELVGYSDNRAGTVRLPPIGMQWHEFTRDDMNGDFRPGYANHAALQGSQPVLLVVKKNGPDWSVPACGWCRSPVPSSPKPKVA